VVGGGGDRLERRGATVAGERLNSPYSLRPRPPTRPGSWSWAGASEIIYDARVPLHPLTAGFAEVAGAYERGRPEYAPAVVGAIAAELDIPAAGPVLDLAAGTGKLTRALLGVGLDVVAVEPQPELRELLAASVGSEHVREGLAEAIPLPDQSVAVVTVADAFHWFDHAVALAEIKRVLRPGGGLAVLSAVPDWSGASWAHEVGTLIAGMLTAHPKFDGPPWQESVRAAGGWSEPREIRVTTSQPASPDRMVDYIASMSWVASLPPDQRAETLAKVDAIISAGETPPKLPIHVAIGLTALA
jgi:SAM-dependent methyltransferase